MSIPAYENSVRGQLFQIAHEIIDVERDVNVFQAGDAFRWSADPDIFRTPVSIDDAKVKFAPKRHSFWIDKMTLEINDERLGLTREGEGTLNDDEYALYFLDKLAEIRMHPHDLCIAALTAKKAAEEEAYRRRMSQETRLSWK